MLKHLKTEQELQNTLEATKDFPTFLFHHYSVRTKLYNEFPEADINIFLHENPTGAKLWLAYIQDPWTCEPLLIISSKEDDKFYKDVLSQAFDEFARMYPNLYFDDNNSPWALGHEIILNLYIEWCNKTMPHIHTKSSSVMCYYATEAQQQNLLDTKIVLPPGYKFAVVDFDSSDAEIINDTWEYKHKNELPMTIAKLRNKPYSLIKDINNYPVAYAISTLYSLIVHHYVHPEHRLKGLAKAIDIDMAQKCIKLGITPYKLILPHNIEVVNSVDRSPFWSRWNYEGKLLPFVWVHHIKK